MKCTYDTSMHWDITERKSNNNIYFLHLCLYVCEKYKEPDAFVSRKTL